MPFDDVLFMMAASKITGTVKAKLVGLGFVDDIDRSVVSDWLGDQYGQMQDGTRELTEVGIVDDAADPIIADACDIVPKVRQEIRGHASGVHFARLQIEPGASQVRSGIAPWRWWV